MEIKLYPTSSLRFVERDGKKILQQKWGPFFNGPPEDTEDWRDVPLVPAISAEESGNG
jgi:hypothetical protein